jgi:hypothetical protein
MGAMCSGFLDLIYLKFKLEEVWDLVSDAAPTAPEEMIRHSHTVRERNDRFAHLDV